ncbi:MAG: glycosyltransferase [Bacteroidota bacterium]
MKKIINILNESPAYSFYENLPRPEIWWETSNGQGVGIWGYDWPDQLGNEILKLTGEFQYEVWQPDVRADKEYFAKLNSGVVHRLFPATQSTSDGSEYWSNLLITKLFQEKNNRIILHLNDYQRSTQKLIEVVSAKESLPIVLTGHGSFATPLALIKRTRRIWKIPNLIIQDRRLCVCLENVDIITEQREKVIKDIRRVFKKSIFKLTMGCDFEFWHFRPPTFNRSAFDSRYNTKTKKVFLLASNFTPGKQIDRLIKCLKRNILRENFLILFVGHGMPEYEAYLHELAEPWIKTGNIAFHDYVRNEKLRDLYWAADYFLSTSISEGGPVSVFQAFGCGLPVISTNTGVSAEIMRETSTGLLLDPRRPPLWCKAINDVLEGRIILSTPVKVARKKFSWEIIASQFIQLYKDLWKQYYG